MEGWPAALCLGANTQRKCAASLKYTIDVHRKCIFRLQVPPLRTQLASAICTRGKFEDGDGTATSALPVLVVPFLVVLVQ